MPVYHVAALPHSSDACFQEDPRKKTKKVFSLSKRCGWRQGFSRSQESFLRKLTPLFQLRKKAMWQAGGLPLEKCGMVTVASHTYSAWWRGEERALSSPQVFFFLLLKASFCLRRPRPTFRKRKPDPLLSSDCLSPSPFVTFPQFIPAKKRSEGGPWGGGEGDAAISSHPASVSEADSRLYARRILRPRRLVGRARTPGE